MGEGRKDMGEVRARESDLISWGSPRNNGSHSVCFLSEHTPCVTQNLAWLLALKLTGFSLSNHDFTVVWEEPASPFLTLWSIDWEVWYLVSKCLKVFLSLCSWLLVWFSCDQTHFVQFKFFAKWVEVWFVFQDVVCLVNALWALRECVSCCWAVFHKCWLDLVWWCC